MKYDFDQVIDRYGTQSSKWDNVGVRVGNPYALPMWVADTDFVCPAPVVEAVRKRAEHPIFGYPFIPQEFNDATIRWVKKQHGWDIQSSWIVFTTGIVPVLNTMIQEFTQPGDEVIIQGPVYHPFGNAIRDNDRVISSNALLFDGHKYTIDFDDLERRAQRAKLMIFCSPHNPVGRVWTREELTKIADICERHNLILISDEIHSDLVYPGHEHISIASMSEKTAARTVTCYAPSKTFNIAGLRSSGVVIPNQDIRARMCKRFQCNRAIQQNIFAVPGYVAAYTQCDDYLEQLIPYLDANVSYTLEYFEKHMPKIRALRPEAMYLLWLDCHDMKMSDAELEQFFVHRAGVAVNKGTMFGPEGSGFMRINVGCPRATLETGLDRLHAEYQKLF